MGNFEVVSAVHGIGPKSEELTALELAVIKRKASVGEFDDLRRQEANEWLEWQNLVGIDIQEDGRLQWEDHLRPIVKASTGFAPDIDAAPEVQWFGTDTTYRRPTITGKLQFDVDAFVERLPPLGKTLSLASVEEFAQLCDNTYEKLDPLVNVTRFHRQIVKALGSVGVERIVFTRHGKPSKNIGGAESRIACSIDGPEIVQVPVGKSAHAYGINSGATSGGAISPGNWPERWLPIVSGNCAEPERLPTPREIEFLRHNDLGRLVLTHSHDLRVLTLEQAKQKVDQLAEITAVLRKELEVAE